MKTRIKICGLRSAADAVALQGLDIAAAGLILAPGRKRSLERKQAQEIIKHLPPQIEVVGVLVNPTREEVIQWTSTLSLTTLQLHGDESPAFCRWVKEKTRLKVVKVLHVGEEIPDSPDAYLPWIDAVLFDSTYKGQRGGTGRPFPWEQIPQLREGWHCPHWIAGGINAENVVNLLRQYHPDGIDVSSGVEVDGVKSRGKIKELVEKVREL